MANFRVFIINNYPWTTNYDQISKLFEKSDKDVKSKTILLFGDSYSKETVVKDGFLISPDSVENNPATVSLAGRK